MKPTTLALAAILTTSAALADNPRVLERDRILYSKHIVMAQTGGSVQSPRHPTATVRLDLSATNHRGTYEAKLRCPAPLRTQTDKPLQVAGISIQSPTTFHIERPWQTRPHGHRETVYQCHIAVKVPSLDPNDPAWETIIPFEVRFLYD